MEAQGASSNWMMTCPIKAYTGFDCPGCGFQRALQSVSRLELKQAWDYYPPIFPFLLTMALLCFAVYSKWRHRLRILLGSFIFTILVWAVSYTVKVWTHFH